MTENQEGKDRNARFLREMETAERLFTPLPLTLNLTECLMLIAHMKIALSHPRNNGRCGRICCCARCRAR
jgi:hypothetical protein